MDPEVTLFSELQKYYNGLLIKKNIIVYEYHKHLEFGSKLKSTIENIEKAMDSLYPVKIQGDLLKDEKWYKEWHEKGSAYQSRYSENEKEVEPEGEDLCLGGRSPEES